MGCDGWFFKGGSTQNRWAVMGDFSKGGVHKTDWLWWVIFQRGQYTKPMGFDGWFFKGGSTQNRWILMGDFSKGGVHKTDGFWWVLECFLLLLKIKRPGRLFRQIRYINLYFQRDYDMARRASDVDMIDPVTCDAGKAQSRYTLHRNNSLEQYERSLHPEQREKEQWWLSTIHWCPENRRCDKLRFVFLLSLSHKIPEVHSNVLMRRFLSAFLTGMDF